MGLNKYMIFIFETVSVLQAHFVSHNIPICNSPTHPNIKRPVKISKSKAVLGTDPDSEIRVPGLIPDPGHAQFSHSMRPCVFRFKLVLIVHFVSVCVVSAVASGERVVLNTINTPEAGLMKID